MTTLNKRESNCSDDWLNHYLCLKSKVHVSLDNVCEFLAKMISDPKINEWLLVLLVTKKDLFIMIFLCWES